jgi:DNA-binding NarL/FixJ family response regulator
MATLHMIRTLVVDDSPIFLRSIERFMAAQEGIEVIGRASTGQQAVALSDQLQPDLVLMDCTMPGMGGIEAAGLIKARPHPPRVVMLSFNDPAEYEEAARKRGADAYMLKSELGACLCPLIHMLFAPSSAMPRAC